MICPADSSQLFLKNDPKVHQGVEDAEFTKFVAHTCSKATNSKCIADDITAFDELFNSIFFEFHLVS